MKSINSFVALALLAGVVGAGLGVAAVAYNGDPQCGSYESVCICADDDPYCEDV